MNQIIATPEQLAGLAKDLSADIRSLRDAMREDFRRFAPTDPHNRYYQALGIPSFSYAKPQPRRWRTTAAHRWFMTAWERGEFGAIADSLDEIDVRRRVRVALREERRS